MKNKFISVMLAAILTMSVALPVQAAEKQGTLWKYCTIEVEKASPAESRIKARIDELRRVYPEGMRCTNDDFYYIDPATGKNTGNSGCYAFAMYVFDHAFGIGAFDTAKGTVLTAATYDRMKPGDHIRIHDLPHSQIVLEVHEDHVLVAEGNCNNAVCWDNIMTKQELLGYDAVSFYSAY